jgi:hypothetical protein
MIAVFAIVPPFRTASGVRTADVNDYIWQEPVSRREQMGVPVQATYGLFTDSASGSALIATVL